jgi:hypothetical protein
MADINARLSQLQRRRRGLDRLDRLTINEQAEIIRKAIGDEAWQTRASAEKPYTRYALGAMQAVGETYTRVSIETAERVGNQLQKDLTAANFSVEFRLQGSVPLDVHIRGVSDVDLLTLDTGFLTYSTSGIVSQLGGYRNPTEKTSLGVIVSLRGKSASILEERFPAAKVDKSGGKAITISGGSLPRSVDVVPSHWHDNVDYQRTRSEVDRTVTIANIKVPETIENLPFLHIKRVSDVDNATLGGLKKAIRLCKNVRSDADGEIAYSSFDLAATMYHADRNSLLNGSTYELAILAETQRHLDYLTTHEVAAKQLLVPDGSRPIFDNAAKLVALRKLSIEMDSLAKEVAKEQNLLLNFRDHSLADSRAALSSTYIPY